MAIGATEDAVLGASSAALRHRLRFAKPSYLRACTPARSTATANSKAPAQKLTGAKVSGSLSPTVFQISQMKNQSNVTA